MDRNWKEKISVESDNSFRFRIWDLIQEWNPGSILQHLITTPCAIINRTALPKTSVQQLWFLISWCKTCLGFKLLFSQNIYYLYSKLLDYFWFLGWAPGCTRCLDLTFVRPYETNRFLTLSGLGSKACSALLYTKKRPWIFFKFGWNRNKLTTRWILLLPSFTDLCWTIVYRKIFKFDILIRKLTKNLCF